MDATSILVVATIAAALFLVTVITVRRAVAAERAGTVQAAVDSVVGVAGRQLGEHLASGSREMELRSQAVDQQLDALQGELHRVTDAVAGLQQDRARQHGELVAGLTEAARSTASLTRTTEELRRALASPNARGQWGERMADDVLRLAGFVEGINYRKQQALASGHVPDVTFLLPGDLLLHMDVKFPVANYLRALEAESAEEQARAEVAFARDVRQRVKEVAARGYIEPGVTVDYVLVFIPNESVYSFVHERDPTLVDQALAQRVVLCSPFTLFAVLAVIRQAVDSLRVERAADDVLRCLGEFNHQWQQYAAQVDLVGKHLDRTHAAFDDLAGPRRRQLQRRLDALGDLRQRRGLTGEEDDQPALRPVAEA